MRGGRAIPLKKTVDEALMRCPEVKHVFVLKRTGSTIPWLSGRDTWLQEAMVEHVVDVILQFLASTTTLLPS
jgi:acetyl-CoA synthetase